MGQNLEMLVVCSVNKNADLIGFERLKNFVESSDVFVKIRLSGVDEVIPIFYVKFNWRVNANFLNCGDGGISYSTIIKFKINRIEIFESNCKICHQNVSNLWLPNGLMLKTTTGLSLHIVPLYFGNEFKLVVYKANVFLLNLNWV